MFLDTGYRWGNNLSHCDSFIVSERDNYGFVHSRLLCKSAVLQEIIGPFHYSWVPQRFLAMPLLLSYSNILIFVGKRHHLLLTTLKSVIPFTILVGLFWEYITPLYRTSKCCDPYDLIAYTLGSLLYLVMVNTFKNRKI